MVSRQQPWLRPLRLGLVSPGGQGWGRAGTLHPGASCPCPVLESSFLGLCPSGGLQGVVLGNPCGIQSLG